MSINKALYLVLLVYTWFKKHLLITGVYIMGRYLEQLTMKNLLVDRKNEYKKLDQSDKRYMGNYLNDKDNVAFDSVNELKGNELTFSDSTFEDGMEVINNNKGE